MYNIRCMVVMLISLCIHIVIHWMRYTTQGHNVVELKIELGGFVTNIFNFTLQIQTNWVTPYTRSLYSRGWFSCSFFSLSILFYGSLAYMNMNSTLSGNSGKIHVFEYNVIKMIKKKKKISIAWRNPQKYSFEFDQ